MIRKISFLLLSIGILYIGYISFRNLSYWERSIRIFKYDKSMAFEGRGGRGGFEGRGTSRGREGFRQPESGRAAGRGFQRPQSGDLSDSLSRMFQERRRGFNGRSGNVTDSLRRESGGARFGRPGTNGEIRNGERRGRGGFPGGRKINLKNVYWFLAVFASITVLVIYIDKAVCLIKKKSSTKPA